jgi:hypothetical protein
MYNQFILEARYLDKIKRVRRKELVGVFANLEKIEEAKVNLAKEETKYTLAFNIIPKYDPFLKQIA